jgi:hypothetical protein
VIVRMVAGDASPRVDTTVPGDEAVPDEQGDGGGSGGGSPSLVTATTIPEGCPAPTPAQVAFLGRLTARDDLTATYELVQVRAGDLGHFSDGATVTVRYPNREVEFLDPGETYLVGAKSAPYAATLESKVREPSPLFGGDAVVGVDEADAPCPEVEDPVMTILPDGRRIDAGVLATLRGETGQVALAVLVPAGLAFALLAGLVLLKRLVAGSRAGR